MKILNMWNIDIMYLKDYNDRVLSQTFALKNEIGYRKGRKKCKKRNFLLLQL